MIGGSALSSRAVGDTAPRDLASEWGGPEPSAVRDAMPVAREPARRVKPRKP
jgi:hypothetical protein